MANVPPDSFIFSIDSIWLCANGGFGSLHCSLLSHYCYMFKVESGNEYANNIKIYIYFYDFIPIVCDGMARHTFTLQQKGFDVRTSDLLFFFLFFFIWFHMLYSAVGCLIL